MPTATITASSAVLPAVDGSQPCKAHPELFFSEPGAGEEAKTRTAKWLCRTACAFQPDCLAYAMAHAEAGVWGGMSERERRDAARSAGIKMVTPKMPNALQLMGTGRGVR